MNKNKKSDFENEAEKISTYEFDRKVFIVEPIFKEHSNDTLGTVLLRLMNMEK